MSSHKTLNKCVGETVQVSTYHLWSVWSSNQCCPQCQAVDFRPVKLTLCPHTVIWCGSSGGREWIFLDRTSVGRIYRHVHRVIHCFQHKNVEKWISYVCIKTLATHGGFTQAELGHKLGGRSLSNTCGYVWGSTCAASTLDDLSSALC